MLGNFRHHIDTFLSRDQFDHKNLLLNFLSTLNTKQLFVNKYNPEDHPGREKKK